MPFLTLNIFFCMCRLTRKGKCQLLNIFDQGLRVIIITFKIMENLRPSNLKNEILALILFCNFLFTLFQLRSFVTVCNEASINSKTKQRKSITGTSSTTTFF